MAVEPTWETLDWAALDRLRGTFLEEVRGAAPYWTRRSDLANYDFTFGRRIGWKWDAVLGELRARGWNAPPGDVLDWGCGSGIAGRKVVEFLGPLPSRSLRLFDKSTLAVEFAAAAARQAFPDLQLRHEDEPMQQSNFPVGVLVVSHVLNELSDADREILRRDIDRSASVLWVEPGTHTVSRELIAWRESLLGQFGVVAPCTHAAPCGMLAPANDRHWCHHFAEPPAGIMADSDWVRFSQRAGIDLRRLPYSFLVLDRQALKSALSRALPDGGTRVIGEPRIYKGFARLLSCQSDGVRELRLQKRVDPALFRALKSGQGPAVLRCRVAGDDIVQTMPLDQGIENDTARPGC